MSSSQILALTQISAAVLADCAFVITDAAGTSQPLGSGLVHAVVPVHGEYGAVLILSLPRALATQIASDMLGISADDPETEAQAEGAIAELANVLVGALVERFCKGEACELGLPEVYTGELPSEPNTGANTTQLRTDSGELIRVSWEMSARGDA